MSKSNKYPHMGAWLKVDEENKKVLSQVDPSWMKNANEEEQKKEFSKLKAMEDIYRRSGYEIIEITKSLIK